MTRYEDISLTQLHNMLAYTWNPFTRREILRTIERKNELHMERLDKPLLCASKGLNDLHSLIPPENNHGLSGLNTPHDNKRKEGCGKPNLIGTDFTKYAPTEDLQENSIPCTMISSSMYSAPVGTVLSDRLLSFDDLYKCLHIHTSGIQSFKSEIIDGKTQVTVVCADKTVIIS